MEGTCGEGVFRHRRCHPECLLALNKQVSVYGGAGASDRAYLYDSPGNDRLTAAGKAAIISYADRMIELSHIA